MTRRVADSTVRRLSLYLRLARELRGEGRHLVSSRELAERSGTSPAQVRKDLSLFGSFGKRGRGYGVEELARALEAILGLGRPWRVGVVGVGKIGAALLGYRDLAARGFDVVAAFDRDPDKTGRMVSGVRVSPMADLEQVLRATGVEIAIIATPPEAAQGTASRLAAAGVFAILNFAPVKLQVPEEVAVRTMDVALELEGLTFLLNTARRDAPGARSGETDGRRRQAR